MGSTTFEKYINSQPFVRFSSFPILLFLAQRVILSGLGIALFIMGKVPASEDALLRPYFGITPVFSGIPGALLGVWQRFDVVHFMRIAQSGYIEADLAPFFPLYPTFCRLIANLIGGDYLLGAMLVSNLACLLALCLFYAWMQAEWQDEKLTKQALLLLVWFPTSFFLFVPYSESVFLLFAILALYSARRGKWCLTGVAGALAALTRVGGFVLTAVMLAEWVRQRRKITTRKWVSPILAALLPLAAFIGLAFWRSSEQLPNLLDVQATYWGRLLAWPLQGVIEAGRQILEGTIHVVALFDLVAVLGMLLVGMLIIRNLPASYAIYHWGLLLLALSQIRIGQPLASQARFALVLFPAFALLPQINQNRLIRSLLLFTFLVIHLLFASRFIMWGWVG